MRSRHRLRRMSLPGRMTGPVRDNAATKREIVTTNLKPNRTVWIASPMSCLNPSVQKKARPEINAPAATASESANVGLTGWRVSCAIRAIKSSVFTLPILLNDRAAYAIDHMMFPRRSIKLCLAHSPFVTLSMRTRFSVARFPLEGRTKSSANRVEGVRNPFTTVAGIRARDQSCHSTLRPLGVARKPKVGGGRHL